MNEFLKEDGCYEPRRQKAAFIRRLFTLSGTGDLTGAVGRGHGNSRTGTWDTTLTAFE